MKYDGDKHQRRSIRLRGYDYSQTGAYFITICVQGKQCLFGNIESGIMKTNDAGVMVEKWWRELTNKFSHVELDNFVVMPNHFHGIVLLVGADLCVCPDMDGNNLDSEEVAHTGAPLQRVIQWFKTMTTNEYIRGVRSHCWTPFFGKLWQRNYYEHVIRDEQSLNNIRNYILANPSQWDHDEENPLRFSHNEGVKS